jgi:hypothetical protein
MTRPTLITKTVGVGMILTLMAAATLVFLVFFAKQFHLVLVMVNVIAFQLSFIWTCAEILDGAGDDARDDDDGPVTGQFTH